MIAKLYLGRFRPGEAGPEPTCPQFWRDVKMGALDGACLLCLPSLRPWNQRVEQCTIPLVGSGTSYGLATNSPAMVIEAVEVWFELEHKHVDVHLGLGLGETTCITPFVSLIQSQQTAVDGIQLDGLQLLWEMDDVTVVASALMDDAEFFIAEDARIYPQDGGVTLAYVLLPDCIRSIDEVEFALGLEVGDEGCCAPSRFGVYAYFDSDHGKLFDFVGLRFLFNDWITDSLSWSAEGWFEYEAYQRIEFTVSYAWGEPRIVSSAEGSSCCYYLPY